MEKSKSYRHVKFDSDTIGAADKVLRGLVPDSDTKSISYSFLRVQADDATWSYDTLEEFLAAANLGDGDTGFVLIPGAHRR